jgi:SRSO17 transposase
MERRFSVRMSEVLAECEVSPRAFDGVLERLVKFVEPFGACLSQPKQRLRATDYLSGLISDLARKNVESIAYGCDQDRKKLQNFIGLAPWRHEPLMQELARQVGEEIGEADGVIVIDPSGFPKQGKRSVGVARQWCGRLGKVDNCQVGVYMAYVSRQDYALVNTRLYLPREWTSDRLRCRKAGVPKGVRFQTRHALALEMLKEQSHLLPHGWIAGDDEMGKSSGFRRDLRLLGKTYLLAVPCDTTIRDLEATPASAEQETSAKIPFQRVEQWRDALAESAWTKVNVRDGEKGPLVVEVATCRVQTMLGRRVLKSEEMLVVIRYVNGDRVTKVDFYLSNASHETPKEEFARVALAAHRVEEAIKRGKSEAGMADYEVRNWRGWHHHQVLSLMASWFLSQETRRGKKKGACADDSTATRSDCGDLASPLESRHPNENRPRPNPPFETQRTRSLLSLQAT